jgi:hypothetical protein
LRPEVSPQARAQESPASSGKHADKQRAEVHEQARAAQEERRDGHAALLSTHQPHQRENERDRSNEEEGQPDKGWKRRASARPERNQQREHARGDE